MSDTERQPDNPFAPPVDMGGAADLGVAEAALDALTGPPPPPGNKAADLEGPARTPAPRGAKRGLASPRHSKKVLRENIKTLERELAEKDVTLESHRVNDVVAGVIDTVQAEEEAAGAVKFALTESFDLLVTLRGNHWKRPEEQVNRVARLWAKPLAPHWGASNPWLVALMGLAFLVGPPLAEEFKTAKQAKKETPIPPPVEARRVKP